jgi:hypothetical protein
MVSNLREGQNIFKNLFLEKYLKNSQKLTQKSNKIIKRSKRTEL